MDDQSMDYDLSEFEEEEFDEALQIEAADPNAFYSALTNALERLAVLEAEMEDSSLDNVA